MRHLFYRALVACVLLGWVLSSSACGGSSGGARPAENQGSGADGASGPGAGDPGSGGQRPLYDWTLIIGTGQSLSIGALAENVSKVERYGNLKLVDRGPDPKYPIDGSGAPIYAAVPLTEPIRSRVAGSGPGYDDGQYPNNLSGETPHSGMASQISAMWRSRSTSAGSFITAHAVVGRTGHPLVDIDKAGMHRAYPASLAEARAFKALSEQQQKTFGVGAIVLTHGESDAANPEYLNGLLALYSDYNEDLKQISGQSQDVLLLISQQSTVAAGAKSSATAAFEAGRALPGKIVCVGPKYAYEYLTDHTHLQAGSYIRLGQKYGEVFDKIFNQKIDWKPLGPRSAVRNGNSIAIAFDVPTPPLVWDTNVSPPHQNNHSAWREGRGFEVFGPGETEIEIVSAEIQGDTVLLTMANPPDPGARIDVGYATVQDGPGLQGGTDQGLRGQLRDSNETPAYDDEVIQVSVTNGSANVTSRGGFTFRAGYDRVSGTALAANTIVRSVRSHELLELSTPWAGASGQVGLSFKRNLYNYAVHFSMPVE